MPALPTWPARSPSAGRPAPLAADEAAVMLAALATCADGGCSHAEDQAARAAVAGPVRRLGVDGVLHAMHRLRTRVLLRGVPQTLLDLRAALPEAAQRREAFGAAVRIAYGDGVLHGSEAEHLAEVALALDLGEEDIVQAMERGPGAPRVRDGAPASGGEPARPKPLFDWQ